MKMMRHARAVWALLVWYHAMESWWLSLTIVATEAWRSRCLVVKGCSLGIYRDLLNLPDGSSQGRYGIFDAYAWCEAVVIVGIAAVATAVYETFVCLMFGRPGRQYAAADESRYS